MDPNPGGSGLYWIEADSDITELLLTHKDITFGVITDHGLHAEGAITDGCKGAQRAALARIAACG